jgi:hypothetical protein
MQDGGVIPHIYNLHHALVAAIEDDDMERSDLLSFAHAARAKEEQYAAGHSRQGLSQDSHVQGVKMFKEWKEARERMLADLEAHVKAAGDLLAKFQKESGTAPAAGSRKLEATMEVKAEQMPKKRKSEQLLEQIEGMAETFKRLKGEGAF